ncbi:MAG: hypothetical protein ABR569_11405 [Gaiellaceae bacterium]
MRWLRSRIRIEPLGRSPTRRRRPEMNVFLLSDASSWMTGQSVNVAGGMITY